MPNLSEKLRAIMTTQTLHVRPRRTIPPPSKLPVKLGQELAAQYQPLTVLGLAAGGFLVLAVGIVQETLKAKED